MTSMRALEESNWEKSSFVNTHHGQPLSVALTQEVGPDDFSDAETSIEAVERSVTVVNGRSCTCQQGGIGHPCTCQQIGIDYQCTCQQGGIGGHQCACQQGGHNIGLQKQAYYQGCTCNIQKSYYSQCAVAQPLQFGSYGRCSQAQYCCRPMGMITYEERCVPVCRQVECIEECEPIIRHVKIRSRAKSEERPSFKRRGASEHRDKIIQEGKKSFTEERRQRTTDEPKRPDAAERRQGEVLEPRRPGAFERRQDVIHESKRSGAFERREREIREGRRAEAYEKRQPETPSRVPETPSWVPETPSRVPEITTVTNSHFEEHHKKVIVVPPKIPSLDQGTQTDLKPGPGKEKKRLDKGELEVFDLFVRTEKIKVARSKVETHKVEHCGDFRAAQRQADVAVEVTVPRCELTSACDIRTDCKRPRYYGSSCGLASSCESIDANSDWRSHYKYLRQLRGESSCCDGCEARRLASYYSPSITRPYTFEREAGRCRYVET